MENRVKFKIGEIEFEAEGSAEVIERERNVFMNALLPAAVDAIVRTRGVDSANQYIENNETPLIEQVDSPINDNDSSVIVNNQPQDFSRTSLSAFLSNKCVLSEQDFVLMAAYYDEKKNKVKSFNSETVKQYYSDARRPKCSNISDALLKLTQKGYIMDDESAEQKSPKPYTLTTQGIEYIETYTPKDSVEKKASKVRKPRAKSESIYSEINPDELNLDNYPDIKKLKKFKEQMLLIMFVVTQEQKGDAFSVADIQCLMTDILGLPATRDQINGVFQTNKSWFKKEDDPNNQKAYKRKLLQGAKDFIIEVIEKNKTP